MVEHPDDKRNMLLVDDGTRRGASDASADFEDAALGGGLAGAAVAAVGGAATAALGAIDGIPGGSIGIAAGGIVGLALGCAGGAAVGCWAERMLRWLRQMGVHGEGQW
jgi:hypothetical protein